MADLRTLDEEEIRQAVSENPKARTRDLATSLGISEGALVAAHVGHGTLAISPHPDEIIPNVGKLGTVMALTRNDSAVHEKVGVYENYHSGSHAAMVLNEAIDLRIFPNQWRHAFAVETDAGEGKTRRSLQVFDAAGDAVHKVHLRENSQLDAWSSLVTSLQIDPDSKPEFQARVATEKPKADPAKADILRQEWAKMTDTHQFMRLTSKLKMNRLGAYRIAGQPFAERLDPGSLNEALQSIASSGTPIMVFVGNRGCIQIHSGPIEKLMPMGPWQNVMDPEFNLHLRSDHVAEVWLVSKPTKRGPALSIEAFDSEGGLILQCFGLRKETGPDHSAQFAEISEKLPRYEHERVSQ